MIHQFKVYIMTIKQAFSLTGLIILIALTSEIVVHCAIKDFNMIWNGVKEIVKSDKKETE